MAARLSQKHAGAYYTPDAVAGSLLSWAVRDENDRMLDPSCGDGSFIAGHRNSVGIEQDPIAAGTAMQRAPWALVHEGDFFAWAAETVERFDCAAGNPPFIRYQTFKGEMRARALDLCRKLGAHFSGLTSSWAHFLVATASLLKPGGRMAFVVPAEIGHAPYSAPLLEYLIEHFAAVQIVAVRDKLFPDLSEDCWLLYAEGYGGATSEIRFTAREQFKPTPTPPRQYQKVSVQEWREVWGRRLRAFILPSDVRSLYQTVAALPETKRFGELASVGIGYVTGANDFFHLRPSHAERWDIPAQFLQPSVRKGASLPDLRLTRQVVERWHRNDDAMLLLKLPKSVDLPAPVRRYLDTKDGRTAREAFKCRVREPWYSVPDVQIPDFFLSYMSGREPNLVRNDAHCSCTNSVHSVRLKPGVTANRFAVWGTDFVQLSCELQGHPLGGGMLKLEPREAAQVALPAAADLKILDPAIVAAAVNTMRSWRHYG